MVVTFTTTNSSSIIIIITDTTTTAMFLPLKIIQAIYAVRGTITVYSQRLVTTSDICSERNHNVYSQCLVTTNNKTELKSVFSDNKRQNRAEVSV